MKLGVLALSLATTFAITACSTDMKSVDHSLTNASEAISASEPLVSSSEPLVIESVNQQISAPNNEQPASAATIVETPTVTASENDNKETAAPKTPIQTTEAEQAVIK